MLDYPLLIPHTTFRTWRETLGERRLKPTVNVQRSVYTGNTKNTVDDATCGITDLWVECGRRLTTESIANNERALKDIKTDAKSRHHFAPIEETLKIKWQFQNHMFISAAELELFRSDDGVPKLLWKKSIAWNPGKCPKDGECTFNGNLDKALAPDTPSVELVTKGGVQGAKSVTIDEFFDTTEFPDKCLTVKYSPYMLRMTITQANVEKKPASRWILLDVLVHSINLRWGDVTLLEKDRDDIDKVFKEKILGKDQVGMNPKVEGLEETLIKDLRDTTKGGHARPAPGVKHKVILTSNLFPVKPPEYGNDNKETGDQTDYNEYKKLWGYGPRIPILATVAIRKTDNNGTFRVPEALIGSRILWDWDDNVETRWSDPLTAGETPNFTKDFLNTSYHKRGVVKPTKSCNCPLSFGGKLDDPDTKAHIFPTHDTTGVFPYRVEHCTNRKWASFSYFKSKPVGVSTATEGDREKAIRSTTGVIFQPARMAGDKYAITAYLDYSTTQDSEAVIDVPDPVKKEAGEFEVFRRVNLFYLHYGTPALNCVPGTCLSQTAQLYLKEANVILKHVDTPMDAGFKAAYRNAKETFLTDPKQYEGAYCWPLMFDYFIDDSFGPGSPPVNFREMDDSHREIEDAFKKGQIFEFTNIDARELLKERVKSRGGAVGIQLTKDAKGKLGIFVKQGGAAFRDGDTIIGDASKGAGGKIAIETKPSFWGVTYLADETSTDKRYSEAIDVIINGAPVLVKYSKRGIRRILSTELSDEAKTNVKQALNNCDQSIPPTIKFKMKDKDSENAKERIKNLKEFVQNSVIDRKAWFEKVKSEHAILDNESKYKKVELYDYFPLAFIPMIISEYIKLNHPNDDGIFFLHIPGRTNLKDLAVATVNKPFKEPSLIGGYFPENSKRTQGIVYISSLPAGPKVASNPSKRLESIFAHELAHALFLPHSIKKTGAPPGGEREKKHVKGDTCLMNYDLDSNRFCGLCMIRMRGWKTEPDNYNLGAEKFEYKITVDWGDINSLFENDVTTPKGRQERMQLLGLLNYPLDHPDINACYSYCWQQCERLFPALRGAGDPAIKTLFETEIKKFLVGTNGVLPTDGQFARICVPSFTTMYSLNHLEARIPVADQGKPQSKPYERLILSSNRYETEEHFYTTNKALGKIPLLVTVKMRPKGSGIPWGTAPEAKGVDVHIQLLKPGDFGAVTGPATVNVGGGTSHYNNMFAPPLADKPKAFIQTKVKVSDADTPDAANAETGLGGKRGKLLFHYPRNSEGFFNEIERSGQDDLKVATDENGEAKIIFNPSRIGGDAYKIRFYIGRPTQEKDHKIAGDDVVTMGTMVRWRTIRISRHYRVSCSTGVGNLPAYLKPGGILSSDEHKKQYGTIHAIDFRGHVTREFAKGYCELILEPPALNPATLVNEEANIRHTLTQHITNYPKYNSFSAAEGKAGPEKVPLSTLYDTMTADIITDRTRRTFTVKTRAFPIELGSVSIRPLKSTVDPISLKTTEERVGVEQAVLTDVGCQAGDNGTATGKQDIVGKSINYATGDISIVFKEQQQRNYQVWYKPLSLIDPATLLVAPFPAQTPYLVNLRLPDDYNTRVGAGVPPMEKDGNGNLPKSNNHYLMLEAAKLGLVKALYLDSVARGIDRNNGFNPGLIFIEAQAMDNLTFVGDPGATQEGKAVGQAVFLFTGAKSTVDWYKRLTIHEMSHALYLQHAPGSPTASGESKVEHDDDPNERCVMSYDAQNDGDHCGKCVASLRGLNIRNIR